MRTKLFILLGILFNGFSAVAQQPESKAESLKQDSIRKFLNSIYFKMSSDSLLHKEPTENVIIYVKP